MSNSRIRVRLSKWDEYLASDVKTGVALEKSLQPIMEWNVHYDVVDLPPPNWLSVSLAWKEYLETELRPVKRRHGPPHPGTLDVVLEISAHQSDSVYDLEYRQLSLNWAGVRLLAKMLDRVTNRIRLERLARMQLRDVRRVYDPTVWELVPYDFE